ncbi:pleckstrin homology domain-containing family O member 2-like [Heterodontus francisci]|uniref:pleckstrin homology domain-containing family O member 2-like n=1 Tax=Heterodontus francisci TaxID=7792 RepID=UPI00355BC764
MGEVDPGPGIGLECGISPASGCSLPSPSVSPQDGGSSGRAGWVRKQCGRGLLGGGWKERFIRLHRGRLLIFQQQDDSQCEETVELGKYQRCQELRGFMKRNQFRLVLIRRSGTKVHEPKFQVSDAEEKDCWLSALNEAIGEANNKEFDQVIVDEKNSLDHLTRDRVKINHTRRPPTRQHRKEVASAVSNGMQRLELGAQSLIVEDSTSEEKSKEKVSNQNNKNRPILMPKIKPSNAKDNDGSKPAAEEGEKPAAEEGEKPAAEEGEEPAAEEGEEPAAEEGDLSFTTENVSGNDGESDLQTKASLNANEMEKQRSETNSNSSLNGANLSRVKCASLGDILSESKQTVIRKQFDTYYANVKNKNVEKLEGEIAFELKVTEELLQQVSGNKAAGEQQRQSNITQDSWSTKSAAHLLTEAMAKWSEADKVLQELKGLKELCKKSEALTLEERERRKNLLTVYRRSVP